MTLSPKTKATTTGYDVNTNGGIHQVLQVLSTLKSLLTIRRKSRIRSFSWCIVDDLFAYRTYVHCTVRHYITDIKTNIWVPVCHVDLPSGLFQ